MRTKTALLLLLGLVSKSSHAITDFSLDMRYLLNRSREDEFVQTVGFTAAGEHTELRVNTRMNESASGFTAVDYSINGAYSPWSWLVLTGRVLHRNRLIDPSSSSSFFTSVRLQGRAPWFLSYFFEVGGYIRSHNVSANAFLPVVSGNFTEMFYALNLGLALHPSENWQIRATASTIELVDVYNLNNPYFELATVFRADQTWTGTAYARYQMLLGFGLYDAWVFGFQATIPLNPLASSDK